MNALDFLGTPACPLDVSNSLQALWWAEQGDWHKAHELVQDETTPEAAHVHAHLHREEGDHGNAGYWYQRAGETPFQGPLHEERHAITEKLLSIEKPSGR